MTRELVIKDFFRARKGLYVDGDSILSGNLTVDGNLEVKGDTQLNNISLPDDIDIASLSPNESITNQTKLDPFTGESLLVTGPISINSSTEVKGDYFAPPAGGTDTRVNAGYPWVPDGSLRYNTDTKRMEVVVDGVWQNISKGDFIEMFDTPDYYTGSAGKVPMVNSDETGLIFGTVEVDVPARTISVSCGNNIESPVESPAPAPAPDSPVDTHVSCLDSDDDVVLHVYSDLPECSSSNVSEPACDEVALQVQASGTTITCDSTHVSEPACDEVLLQVQASDTTITCDSTHVSEPACDEVALQIQASDTTITCDSTHVSEPACDKVLLQVQASGPTITCDSTHVSEPACEEVLLQVQSDTTDGNTTFTDGSNKNYTITANGNTQHSDDVVKVGGSSIKFDGVGDYLSVGSPGNIPFGSNVGTDPFTFEAWIYTTGSTTRQCIYSVAWEGEGGYCTGGASYWYISIINGALEWSGRDSGNDRRTSENLIQNNTWHHIAFTYDGSVDSGSGYTTGYTLWVDGSRALEWGSYVQRSHQDGCVGNLNGVYDFSGFNLDNLTQEYIGVDGFANSWHFNGYMQDVRISGKAVYTGDCFGLPTQLLACDNPTPRTSFTIDGGTDSQIREVSDNSHELNIVGDTTVVDDTAVVGDRAISFDGNGDYVTVPNFDLSTTENPDFTIEFWINSADGAPSSYEFAGLIQCSKHVADNSNSWGWMVDIKNSRLGFAYSHTGVANTSINPNSWNYIDDGSGDTTISLNEWHHVAVVRSNNTLSMYIDGKKVVSRTIEAPIFNPGWDIEIGRRDGNGLDFNGKLQDIRISDQAVYTGDCFGLPAQLLACDTPTPRGSFTIEGIPIREVSDNSHELGIVGDVTVTEDASIVNGRAISFDGNGDYLQVESSPDFQFGTSDFTIEFWVNLPSTSSHFYLQNNKDRTTAEDTSRWLVLVNPTSVRFITHDSGGTVENQSIPESLNTWNHIAFVRKDGVMTIYYNGEEVATGNLNLDYDQNGLNIGSVSSHTGTFPSSHAYIQDFRISKKAVYTGECFGLPTQLLTCGGFNINESIFSGESFIGDDWTVSSYHSSAYLQPATINTYNTELVESLTTAGDQVIISTNYGGVADKTANYINVQHKTPFVLTTDSDDIDVRVDADISVYMADGTGYTDIMFSVEIDGAIYSLPIDTVTEGIISNLNQSITLVPEQFTLLWDPSGAAPTSPQFVSGKSVKFGFWLGNGDYAPISHNVIHELTIRQLSFKMQLSVSNPSAEPVSVTPRTSFTIENDSQINDVSDNSHELNIVGDVTVTEDASIVSERAISFDGNGDYVTVPNFDLSTTENPDFTIEFWINSADGAPSSYEVAGLIQCSLRNLDNSYSWGWIVYIRNGKLNFVYSHTGYASSSANPNSWNYIDDGSGDTTISLNEWHHVAVVRSNNTLSMYIDGKKAVSRTIEAPIFNPGYDIEIGRRDGTGLDFNGKLQDIRISDKAVYTGECFGLPTQLLACDAPTPRTSFTIETDSQINDVSDNSHELEIVGDNVTVTEDAPIPDGHAITFPTGNANNLIKVPQTTTLNLQGDFTMEFWVNVHTRGDDTSDHIITAWVGSSGDWQFYRHNDEHFVFRAGSVRLVSDKIVELDTWYHVAIVGDEDNCRMYVNGLLETTETGWSSYTAPTDGRKIWIGGRNMNHGSEILRTNCSIQDIRISKKTVYTGDCFGLPTQLLACDTLTPRDININTNTPIVDSSPVGHQLLVNEDATHAITPVDILDNNTAIKFDGTDDYLQVGLAQNFLGSAHAIEFDGTDDYLQVYQDDFRSPALHFKPQDRIRVHDSTTTSKFFHDGTTPYTLSFWIFPSANTTSSMTIFSTLASSSQTVGVQLSVLSNFTGNGATEPITEALKFGIYNANSTTNVPKSVLDATSTSGDLKFGQWNYVCIVVEPELITNDASNQAIGRHDEGVNIYINGTESPTIRTGYTPNGAVFSQAVASQPATFGYYGTHWMNDMRVQKVKNMELVNTPQARAVAELNDEFLIQSSATTEAENPNDNNAVDATGNYLTPQTTDSASFDNTMSVSNAPVGVNLDSDFSVSFWFYAHDHTAGGSAGYSQRIISFDKIDAWATNGTMEPYNHLAILKNSSGIYVDSGTKTTSEITMVTGTVTTAGQIRPIGTSVPLNTWIHVALSRSGDNYKLFQDGTIVAEWETIEHFVWNTTPVIGALLAEGAEDSAIGKFDGHMQDYRLTKTADYTADFDVPTTLSDPAGAEVLIQARGESTIVDSSGNSYVVVEHNGVTQTKFFTGTFQAESSTLNFLHELDTDYTVETWFNINQWVSHGPDSTSGAMLMNTGRMSDSTGMYMSLASTGLITYGVYPGFAVNATIDIETERWYHLAVVYKASGELSMFVDGVLQDTSVFDPSTVTRTGDSAHSLIIGHQFRGDSNTNNRLDGYLQDTRITKQAIYTEDFTPYNKLLNTCGQSCSTTPVTITVSSEYDASTDTRTYKYTTSDSNGAGSLFGCINVERGSTLTIFVDGDQANLESHPLKITNFNDQGQAMAPVEGVIRTDLTEGPTEDYTYSLTWTVPCDETIDKYQYQCENHAHMRGTINVTGTCATTQNTTQDTSQEVVCTLNVPEQFTDLTDTPDIYTGQSGKVAMVNTEETGLIFGNAPNTTSIDTETRTISVTEFETEIISIPDHVSCLDSMSSDIIVHLHTDGDTASSSIADKSVYNRSLQIENGVTIESLSDTHLDLSTAISFNGVSDNTRLRVGTSSTFLGSPYVFDFDGDDQHIKVSNLYGCPEIPDYAINCPDSNSYLKLPYSEDINFSSGDFTIESWVLVTTELLGSYIEIFRQSIAVHGSDGYGPIAFGVTAPSDAGDVLTYRFLSRLGASAIWDIDQTITTNVRVNEYHHVAIQRSGSTVSVFINGTEHVISTNAPTTYNPQFPMHICGTPTTGSYNFASAPYMSNIRFVKGTALYTDGFTPSLTIDVVDGTTFLTGTSTTIEDTSSTPNDITVSGNATAIETSTVPRLGCPPEEISASTGVVLDSDFTISFWANRRNNNLGNSGWNQRVFSIGGTTNTTYSTTEKFLALMTSSTQFGMDLWDRAASDVTVIKGSRHSETGQIHAPDNYSSPLNEWYYVKFIRSGVNNKLYLNGECVVEYNETTKATITGPVILGGVEVINTGDTWKSADASSVGNFDGLVQDFRIVESAEDSAVTSTTDADLSVTHNDSQELNKELRIDVKAGSGTFIWDLTFNNIDPIPAGIPTPNPANINQVDVFLVQGTGYSTSISSYSNGVSDGGISDGTYAYVRGDSDGKATLKIDYTSDADRTIVLRQQFTANLISGIYKGYYATWNSNDAGSNLTLTEGNTQTTSSGNPDNNVRATLSVSEGSWYWENTITSGGPLGAVFGIAGPSFDISTNFSGDMYGYTIEGDKIINGNITDYGDAYAVGDIIGVAFDADNLQIEFFKNNISQGVITGITPGISWKPFVHNNGQYNITTVTNFGVDGTFAGNVEAGGNSDANGYGDFKYPVPAGYLALNDVNLSPEEVVEPGLGCITLDGDNYLGLDSGYITTDTEWWKQGFTVECSIYAESTEFVVFDNRTVSGGYNGFGFWQTGSGWTLYTPFQDIQFSNAGESILNEWQTIKLEVVGTTLNLYQNGVIVNTTNNVPDTASYNYFNRPQNTIGSIQYTPRGDKITTGHIRNFKITSSGGDTVASIDVAQCPGIPEYAINCPDSDSYLKVPYSEDVNFSSGDFTIESWVLVNSTGTGLSVFRTSTTVNGDGAFGNINVDINNNIGINTQSGEGLTYRILSRVGATNYQWDIDETVTTDVRAGEWHHVALQRSGSDLSLFINGTEHVISTDAATMYNPSYPMHIGGTPTTGNFNFDSAPYMSNIRFVKGTALYTDGFTPSLTIDVVEGTTFLTGTSTTIEDISPTPNTIIVNGNATAIETSTVPELECTSEIVDKSNNDHTITNFGDVTIEDCPDGGLDCLTIDGQGAVFNGSNSQISIPTLGAELYDNDFSISLWVKLNNFNAAGSTAYLFSGAGSRDVFMNFNGAGGISARIWDGVAPSVIATVNYDVSETNRWYHVIFTRSKTDGMKLYVDGVLRDTDPFTDNGRIQNFGSDGFGMWMSNQRNTLDGELDQVRIYSTTLSDSDAIKLFNESVDVPTTGLVAHYKFDGNADDSVGSNNGTETAITYSSGAYHCRRKVASGCFTIDDRGAVFNGTSSFIDTGGIDLGTNYTLSVWANFNSFPPPDALHLSGGSVLLGERTNKYAFWVSNDNQIWVASAEGVFYTWTVPSLSLSEWYHFAFTRNGATGELFVNGQSYGASDNFSSTTFTLNYIGCQGQDRTSGYYLDGRMDDLRVYSDVLTDQEIQHITSNDTANIPVDNLTAHYKFDGNADDSVGSNNGTETAITYDSGVYFCPPTFCEITISYNIVIPGHFDNGSRRTRTITKAANAGVTEYEDELFTSGFTNTDQWDITDVVMNTSTDTYNNPVILSKNLVTSSSGNGHQALKVKFEVPDVNSSCAFSNTSTIPTTLSDPAGATVLLQAGPDVYTTSTLSTNGELVGPCRLFDGQAMGDLDYGHSGESPGSDWTASQTLHRTETTMQVDGSNLTYNTDGTELTFTPDSPIPYNTSVEINVWDNGDMYPGVTKTYKFNDEVEVTIPNSTQNDRNGYKWVTVATGSGELNTLTVRIAGPTYKDLHISAIRVDGKLLSNIVNKGAAAVDEYSIAQRGDCPINTLISTEYSRDPESFNFLHDGTSSYTVESWVKFDDLDHQMGLYKTSTSTHAGLVVEAWADGSISAKISQTYSANDSWKDSKTPAGVITAGEWYHVAVVLNMADVTLSIYVNGNLIDNVSDAATSPNPPTGDCFVLQIGQNTSSGPLDGFIQDFRVTKQALYTSDFTPVDHLLVDCQLGRTEVISKKVTSIVVPDEATLVHKSEAVGDFLDLTDTPTVYTGESGRVAMVNDTEDGLIFGTVEVDETQRRVSVSTATKKTKHVSCEDVTNDEIALQVVSHGKLTGNVIFEDDGSNLNLWEVYNTGHTFTTDGSEYYMATDSTASGYVRLVDNLSVEPGKSYYVTAESRGNIHSKVMVADHPYASALSNSIYTGSTNSKKYFFHPLDVNAAGTTGGHAFDTTWQTGDAENGKITGVFTATTNEMYFGLRHGTASTSGYFDNIKVEEIELPKPELVGRNFPGTSAQTSDEGWIQVTDGAWNIINSDTYTISFWLITPTDASELTIFSQQGAADNVTNAQRPIYIRKEGSKFSLNGNEQLADVNITDNNWHHIAVTVQDANAYKIYIDGVLVVDQVGYQWANASDGPNTGVRIGRQYGSYGEYFNGTLGDMLVYSRVLTPEEISTINDNHKDYPDDSLLMVNPLTNREDAFDVGGDNIRLSTRVEDQDSFVSGKTPDFNDVLPTPFLGSDTAMRFDHTGTTYVETTQDVTLNGDFTIEWWANVESHTEDAYIGISFFSIHDGANNIETSRKLNLGYDTTHIWYNLDNIATYPSSTAYGVTPGFDASVPTPHVVPLNQWSHYVMVREGLNHRLYVNGEKIIDFDEPGNSPMLISGTVNLGGGLGGISIMDGWMQDFRITSKAVYTDNFTPSTELTSECTAGDDSQEYIINTVTVPEDFLDLADTPTIYTGESGRVAMVNDTEDGLVFGTVEVDVPERTITVGKGTIPTVTTVTNKCADLHVQSSPLVESDRCIRFSGTVGADLIIHDPDNLADPGADDFTVESWIRMYPGTKDWEVIQKRIGGNGTHGGWISINTDTGAAGQIRFYWAKDGARYSFDHNFPEEYDSTAWHHYAVTRSANNVKLYIDGVYVNGLTNLPGTLTPSGYNYIRIGSGFETGQSIGADIQNWQLSSTVRYTDNFTPPPRSVEPVIDSNTLAMLHAHGDIATHDLVTERTGLTIHSYEGGEENIYYDLRNCDPCEIGNRVIGGTLTLDDTTPPRGAQQGVSPVALFDNDRSALWFSGTSQAITTAQNNVTIATDADFTMEAWVYPLDYNTRGGYSPTIFNIGDVSQFRLSLQPTGELNFRHGTAASDVRSTTVVELNKWTHVAWVRESNIHHLYINGVKESLVDINGTSVSDPTHNSTYTGYYRVGALASNINNGEFRGYMQDVRLFTNEAIYNSTTTVPTRLFEDCSVSPTSDYVTHTEVVDQIQIAEDFLDLADTPVTYDGLSGKIVQVNQDETGVEFVDNHVASTIHTITRSSAQIMTPTGPTGDTTDWTPTNSTVNVSGWWDASDENTQTIQNTDEVTTWTDKSTEGNDLSVINQSANGPKIGRTLNGLRVLEWDNTNPAVVGTVMERAPFNWDQENIEMNVYMVIHFDDEGSDADQDFLLEGSATTTDRLFSRVTGDGKIQIMSMSSATGVITEGNTYIVTLTINGSNSVIRVNGTQVASGTAGVNPMTELNIGANVNEQQGLDGFIAEIVMTDDRSETHLIEGYLAHKWGLESELPSDHTYKAATPQHDIVGHASEFLTMQTNNFAGDATWDNITYEHAMVLPYNTTVKRVMLRGAATQDANINVNIHSNRDSQQDTNTLEYKFFPQQPLQTVTQTFTTNNQSRAYDFSALGELLAGQTIGVSLSADREVGHINTTIVLEYDTSDE